MLVAAVVVAGALVVPLPNRPPPVLADGAPKEKAGVVEFALVVVGPPKKFVILGCWPMPPNPEVCCG